MLRFFRRIRHALFASGQTRRYIFYAVGEIALVVIGILIALQVNNWNESRKNQTLEHEYYCRLLDDLNQDRAQLIELKDLAQQRLKASNQAARLLQNESAYKTEVGREMIKGLIGSLREFVPNNSAFEDLKSGGNIHLIRDKSVVKALNNYYQQVDGINQILSYHTNNMATIWYSHRDKFESGWIHGTMEFNRFLQGMESDVYANVEVSDKDEFDPAFKMKIYNDALTFISSNFRAIELCDLIDIEINKVEDTLLGKCEN